MRGPCHTDPTTVYQIMNTVQDVHILYREPIILDRDSNTTCCLSFRIPTPLICLERADTQGIFNSFISCALLTANGIGTMFQAFGLPRGLINSEWKSFIFVGDALRANESAFQAEISELRKKGNPKHLALKIKCSIHQLSLTRKHCVLMVPRLWSTIVRLSHLFEGLQFRKSFAKSLAGIIADSFTYVPCATLPAQSHKWGQVSSELRRSFRCRRSKLRRQNFEKCLAFLNGDLESDCIAHYCLDSPGRACCHGPADSLAKCLRLLVPFFSRGFPSTSVVQVQAF